jgi:hypothetical protein
MGFKKRLDSLEADFSRQQNNPGRVIGNWVVDHLVPMLPVIGNKIKASEHQKRDEQTEWFQRHKDWLQKKIGQREQFHAWRRRLIDKDTFHKFGDEIKKIRKDFKSLKKENDPFQQREYGLHKHDNITNPSHYIDKEAAIRHKADIETKFAREDHSPSLEKEAKKLRKSELNKMFEDMNS